MNDLREMTIGDLLQNPTGKGSAVMASRKLIIQDLEMRFMKLMHGHNNYIETYCFKSKQEEYIFRMKVPAETLPNLYYDVVIMCTPKCDTTEDTESVKGDRTLNRYRLKLFSNSPNFMFTYTYVLNKYDMIVPKLKNKCNPRALTEPPTVKNPVESYGFEKSCYFACRYLKERGLLNKGVIDQNLSVFNELKLQAVISTQEAKLKEYNLIKKANKSSLKQTKRAKNTPAPTTLKKPTQPNKNTMAKPQTPKKPIKKTIKSRNKK